MLHDKLKEIYTHACVFPVNDVFTQKRHPTLLEILEIFTNISKVSISIIRVY